MTEIEYEVREQDLLAFSKHRLKDSESLKKSLRRHEAMVPGVLAIFSMFLWLYYQDTLSAIYAGVTAVAWGILTPQFIKWQTLRSIKKMYSDEERAAIVGSYKLRVAADALVEIGKEGETKLPWSQVLRIEMTWRYAFIFVGLDTALIVPRKTITSGDIHEFIKDADARIEQAGG